METTMPSQMNTAEILIFLIVYAVLTAAMIVLELRLARRENKLYGLIPPAITFLPTIPYLLVSVAGSTIAFSFPAVLAFIVLLIIINFNTIAILIIYRIIRFGKKKKSDLEQA